MNDGCIVNKEWFSNPFFFFASILILLKFCKYKIDLEKKANFNRVHWQLFPHILNSPFFFIFYIFRHANLLLPLNTALQFHLYSIWRLHRIHQISNFKHPFEWINIFMHFLSVSFSGNVIMTCLMSLWFIQWVECSENTNESILCYTQRSGIGRLSQRGKQRH